MAVSQELQLPRDFEITDEMREVIDMVQRGKNVFVTGKAGSGKSTLLTYLREEILPEDCIYCSYTGVASLNIGGQTLHSFFGFLPNITMDHVKSPDYHPKTMKIMKIMKVLVIDEVSMVRADLLDIIDAALRRYGPKPGKPFGGVQLVMFGDLYQLPPIITGDEREFFDDHYGSEFFFDAHLFEKYDYHVFELTKVYRQKDAHLIEMLNAIRINEHTDSQINQLNELVDPDFQPADDDFYITMTSTKALAASINREKLSALKGRLYKTKARITGQFSAKQFPTDEVLTFKVGAQIMLLNNDQNQYWANGTLAKILEVSLNENQEVDQVKVQIASTGDEYWVEPHIWDVLRPRYFNERLSYDVMGSFKQFPFRLSWALTIHKSQGKSFDKVVIDLTHDIFERGQLYVALSRCTSFEGMKLKSPIKSEHIMIDPRIKNYMDEKTRKVLQ